LQNIPCIINISQLTGFSPVIHAQFVEMLSG